MATVLHNFKSFQDEVQVKEEAPIPEPAAPVVQPAAKPAPKPVVKTVRGLYEMIDGGIPPPANANTPRPAARRPGGVGIIGAVKEAFAFLAGR